MRWIFLFLVFLNAFYFVWFQQQTTLKVKDVLPLELNDHASQRIKLVSEEGLSVTSRTEEPATPAPVVTEELAHERVCVFLGGAIGPEQAANLQQRLVGLDIPAEIETAMGTADAHWLYLTPTATEETEKRLKQLQERSIDAKPITEGVLSNAVSLGLITQREELEKLVALLQSENLSFQHNEMSIRKNDFWISIPPEASRLVDDALLKLLAKDFADVQHQLMPCKSVATIQ